MHRSAVPDGDGQWAEVAGDTAVLRFEGMCFTVAGGSTIRIEAPDDKPDIDIRIWLLGTVMAALLHQRDYLPIHANVVALPGDRAAAFAGESGAGKSTLAAWFEVRGHRVLADDLCAIRIGEDGRPQLFEGIPRMKLWRETLEAFGRDPEGLSHVASDLDKYHVPLGRSAEVGSLEPLELERVYLLEFAAEFPLPTIERVTGVNAAHGVLANVFRWGLGQMIQPDPRAQFDQCLAVARHAAVFRVNRRWGMENFAGEAEAIERHLMTPLDELAA